MFNTPADSDLGHTSIAQVTASPVSASPPITGETSFPWKKALSTAVFLGSLALLLWQAWPYLKRLVQPPPSPSPSKETGKRENLADQYKLYD